MQSCCMWNFARASGEVVTPLYVLEDFIFGLLNILIARGCNVEVTCCQMFMNLWIKTLMPRQRFTSTVQFCVSDFFHLIMPRDWEQTIKPITSSSPLGAPTAWPSEIDMSWVSFVKHCIAVPNIVSLCSQTPCLISKPRLLLRPSSSEFLMVTNGH